MPQDTTVVAAPGSPDEGSGTGDGNQSDWRGSLAPEYKDHASLKSYKDLNALAKSHVEAQAYIGGAVKIPGADAKPEDLDKFYSKLGRPESPDKYELSVPEGMVSDTPVMKNFLVAAHKAGLTKGQAQAVVDAYAASAEQIRGGLNDQYKEAEELLRGEWGAAFDRKVALANRALHHIGGQQVIQLLQATGLDNNPGMVRTWAKVGEILAEDGTIEGNVENVPGPDEAKRKIHEVMNDRKHPYHDRRAPGHDEAVDQMQKWFQLSYGG